MTGDPPYPATPRDIYARVIDPVSGTFVTDEVRLFQDGHTYPVLDYSPGASLTEIVQSIVDGSYSQSSSLDRFLDIAGPLTGTIENVQSLDLDNGDIAVAWTLLQPHGVHGARPTSATVSLILQPVS